jgi:hypothetical protein
MLSEAGINVNKLLKMPMDDLFSEYMPNDSITVPEVEMDADHLVLRRACRPPEGWEEQYKQMAKDGADKLMGAESLTPTQWDLTEWEW